MYLYFFIETVVIAVTTPLNDLVLYSVQFGMLFLGQYLVISIIYRFLDLEILLAESLHDFYF